MTLLLVKDVEDLGRSGEVVSVKAGYARNFLVPSELAVIAGEHTLRMQKQLQQERALRAVQDSKEAEELAKLIEKLTLETHVKVDPEGKMYGSVSAQDIVLLLEEHGIKLDRKNVQLKASIKDTGSYTINFKLKENVPANCKLEIIPETIKAIHTKPVEK